MQQQLDDLRAQVERLTSRHGDAERTIAQLDAQSAALAPLSVIELEALEQRLDASRQRVADARRTRAAHERACTVCLSELARMACVPCGHRCLCKACFKSLAAQNRMLDCPICALHVESCIVIYDA
jgi:hypothetical protein